jgi:hypothetical protein
MRSVRAQGVRQRPLPNTGIVCGAVSWRFPFVIVIFWLKDIGSIFAASLPGLL